MWTYIFIYLGYTPRNGIAGSHDNWGASQVVLVVKNSPVSTGDVKDSGLIPGLGRSGGGHGNPLQYSCLENPTDRGAWRATVSGVTESDTTEAT